MIVLDIGQCIVVTPKCPYEMVFLLSCDRVGAEGTAVYPNSQKKHLKH